MKEENITPEDIIRLTLRNLKKWKTVDSIEDNLRKMLWYFEDKHFDALSEEFNIEV